MPSRAKDKTPKGQRVVALKAGTKEGHYDRINVRGFSAKVVKDDGKADLKDPKTAEKIDRGKFVNISPAGLVYLSREIANRPEIQKLDLRHNMLASVDMAVLAAGLEHNQGLRVLNLQHNEIGCKGVQALVEALAPEFDEPSDDGSVSDVSEANQHLLELNLDGNAIGDHGAQFLGHLLENCAIQWLHLFNNRIGSKGARNIADGLRQSKSMHTLIMGCNRIEDDGMTAIAEVIRDGSHLSTLDVGANHITDEGLPAICGGLKKECALRKLSLRVNRILSPGFDMLAVAIQDNKHLTDLDLGANLIRDESLLAMRDLVGYNTHLHRLCLEDNVIGDETGKAILQLLSMNEHSQLTSMDMSNNHVSESTIEKLQLFLRTNKADLQRKQEEKKRARAAEKEASKEAKRSMIGGLH